MTLLLLLVLLFLFFCGFFAAAESSLLYFKSDNESKNKIIGQDDISYFQTNPDKLSALIKMYSTICIIAEAFFTLMIIDKITKTNSTFLFLIKILIVLLLVSVLVILGYLVPKEVGHKYSNQLAPIFVKPLILLDRISEYPIKLILMVANFFLFPFKTKAGFSETPVSEEEIKIMIGEGLKSGEIDKTEHEILENIFEFNDLRANQIMIPRTEMVAIKMIDDDAQMFHDIIKTGHNLVPVYKDSPDNILGIVHIKDLLRQFIEKINVDIKSIIRPAHFVPETKLISEILKEMQKRGERIFIITDEYGGTEGVITLEDILSEIVGEISIDGEVSKEYSELPDGKFIILGSMTLEDFNEIFNKSLPLSEDYQTVAGFIAYQTGKILNSGDIVEFSNIKFELIKKVKQKMVQFKITL